MAAIDQTMVSNILNATTPTGTSGAPGSFTPVGAGAMKVMLTTTAPTASSNGTELTGSGYTAGGTAVPASSTASSSGSSVTLPASSALSWTNGSGGNWAIVGLNLMNNAGTTRTWFGSFNGQPVNVANGNTFQIAVGGVTISLA